MAKIKIDWNEAEGGKFIKQPGEYIVKLVEAELDEDGEGRQYIEWTAKVSQGNNKGATIHFKNYITPKTLWRLRDLLNAINYPITESVQDLDLDDIIKSDVEFVIEVENGNERPDGKGYYMQVSDYMPYTEYDNLKTGIKEEPKEKEASEDDELDEMEEEIDKLGLDIDLDDYDTLEEKRAAFNRALKKANIKAEDKKATVYTREMLEDLGSVELEKIADEIGLELDKDSSPRSKRRSLIQALKECGRFEE